ncbi:MAG TPA: glycosyltransferase [Edaphocola sp.]|nr:glycosyltransferase [Edaphocola sp.]
MKDLISCIMPTTAARKRFLPLAIDNFLQQDYAEKELIILDDSGDPFLNALVPDLPGVRYIRYPFKFMTLGQKRNHACSLASGTIIQHWDDDDYYAPGWLGSQWEALNTEAAQICGLRKLYFFNPLLKKAWAYTYGLNRQAWVAGATMAYYKAFWARRPFRPLNVGEDNHFVWSAGVKVAVNHHTHSFVSMLHGGNTSPKHITDSQWQPVEAVSVAAILGNKREAYFNATMCPSSDV